MSEQPPEWNAPANQPSQNQPPYGAPNYGGYGPPPSDGAATVSLVLGILSLVMCGFLTGIPAMIVARSAKKRIKASGGTLGGEGLATAGFWTGLVGSILSVLLFLAIAALFAFGSSVQTAYYEEACDSTVTSQDPFGQC